jgi:hypothetical protein
MQFVEWANRAMRSSRAAKVTAKFQVVGKQDVNLRAGTRGLESTGTPGQENRDCGHLWELAEKGGS